jgi:hypothetical protein
MGDVIGGIMDIKAILSNGARERTLYSSRKGVNPWDPDSSPEAWLGTTKPNVIALVPAVQSAIQARCKAMSDLPFCIYKGDKEIDNSDDYQNKVGFMPNPRMFLWLTEAALTCYGKAYWLKKSNAYNYVKGSQYFLPDSITAVIEGKGLVQFSRANGTHTEKYKPEEVIYFWLPDPGVEIGPPTTYPLASAMLSASALDKINVFVRDYMERGAVKAMLLAAKQMPSADEAARVETWFNKFMRGAKSLTWKVFNADAINPVIVGEGLEAFKGIQIVDDLTRQIHTAIGTRHMLEDENYATANVRQREFYSNTIMPDARLISDVLNTQVLAALDYRLEFEPERLEVFKQDEADNATALGSLTSAIADAPADVVELAMSIIGYDLTDEEEEMLAEIKKRKEEEKPDVTPVEVKPVEDDPEPLDDEDISAPDMAKWMRKSMKRIGKDVAFVSDTIPLGVQANIHAKLADCKCEDDIRALFTISETVSETPPIVYEQPDYSGLLEAMRLEVEAIKSIPTPWNITVNNQQPSAPVVNMSAAEAPNVTVNVPESVVNVSVEPTPVTIDVKQDDSVADRKEFIKRVRKLSDK